MEDAVLSMKNLRRLILTVPIIPSSSSSQVACRSVQVVGGALKTLSALSGIVALVFARWGRLAHPLDDASNGGSRSWSFKQMRPRFRRWDIAVECAAVGADSRVACHIVRSALP